MSGFADDVDVAQIKHDPSRMIWVSVIGGLLLAVIAGVALGPIWVFVGLVAPDRPEPVRAGQGAQRPERVRRATPGEPRRPRVRAPRRPRLAGAMGVVAEEAPEPSKREFSRVVTDEQLGIPLDEALEVTAQADADRRDIDQVAVLALVQREAGGNTAEVLDQVTANIRARMDIRRLVKVLTAQGKFSSWVIALVPVGILVFLLLVNPSHLDPLFHRTLGQAASVVRGHDDDPRVLRHPKNRHDRALTP